MSLKRTMIEVPMRTGNVDQVLRIMEMILQHEGYERKLVGGEIIWIKGDSAMRKTKCFSAAFTETSVLIQGWLRDAAGETSLEGFINVFIKKKMKELLFHIQDSIIAAKL